MPCSCSSRLLIGTIGGIEIYENTVDGAAYPLGLINTASHSTQTRNVNVHHNLMILRASTTKVGAAAFNGTTDLFSAAADNRFDANVYRVSDTGGAYWAWNGQTLTWTKWQGLGHDVGGVRRTLD